MTFETPLQLTSLIKIIHGIYIVLYISYAKYFHFEIPVIAANLLYLLKCIT